MSGYRVWALFDGGANYSPSDASEPSHWEVFSSLRAVKDAMWRRANLGYDYNDNSGCHPELAYGESGSTNYPCVTVDPEDYTYGQGAQFRVFYICEGDPSDMDDPYPDLIVSVGPRGGIRSERV